MANSDFIRVKVSQFHAKCMELLDKDELTKHELHHVRNETGWSIPNAVWANEIVGAAPRMWKVPSQAHKGKAAHVVPGSAPSIATLDRVPVEELFQDLEDLVDLVISGARKSLLITGATGTGKSYTVYQTLKKNGLNQIDGDWVLVKGKTSAYGVYRTLFMNRNATLVYDDSDDVFAGADTRNLLKAALDTNDKRVLSWQSKATIDMGRLSDEEKEIEYLNIEERITSGDDTVKMPSEFEFKGRIIFISNLEASQMEPALLKRGNHIDITLTNEEMMQRIGAIMDDIEPAIYVENPNNDEDWEPRSMPRDEKEEVLNFLLELAVKQGKLLSIRDFKAGLDTKASGKASWRRLLRYV